MMHAPLAPHSMSFWQDPTGQPCQNDMECGANGACIMGQCQPRDPNGQTPCTANTQCGAGQLCINGGCWAQMCNSNQECGMGQSCVSGICTGP